MKRKGWNPTQKQVSAYEELLKKYNKIRKQIITAHRSLEQYTPSGRMPSLVVPERHRKMSIRQMRISGRTIFRMKMKQLRSIVHGGLQAFFNRYKESYLQLYREYIIGEEPEGYHGRFYSEEQIADAQRFAGEKYAQFLKDYNKLASNYISGSTFTLLLKSGRIPEFKQLYAEFSDKGFTVAENFAEQLHKALINAKFINVKDANRILSSANFSRSSRLLQNFYKKSYELEQVNKTTTAFKRDSQRMKSISAKRRRKK